MIHIFAGYCKELWAIVLISAVLLLGGCEDNRESGGLTKDQELRPSATPQADTTPTSSTPETSATTSSQLSTPESTGVDEVIDFPSLDAYLADMENYTVRMQALFTGESTSGEPVHWTVAGQRSESSDPATFRLNVAVQGFNDQGDIEEMTVVRIGDESYLVIPSVGCISRPANGGESLDSLSLANAYMSGISGAKLMSESSIVNGTSSLHYNFNQNARPDWLEHGLTLMGHLFIAEDDGYINRIELTASGTTQFHPQRDVETGVFSMEVVVSELDASIPIEIPDSCSIPSEYPVIEDAYQITVIDDLATYRSDQPPSDVLSFYETEMLERGWILSEEAILLEDSAFLLFEKDGRFLTVSLELDDDEGAVTVLISP